VPQRDPPRLACGGLTRSGADRGGLCSCGCCCGRDLRPFSSSGFLGEASCLGGTLGREADLGCVATGGRGFRLRDGTCMSCCASGSVRLCGGGLRGSSGGGRRR
jgi:hypothetical protein